MGEDNLIVHWRRNSATRRHSSAIRRYLCASLKKEINAHHRDYTWSLTRLTESDSPAPPVLPPSTLLFRFWLFFSVLHWKVHLKTTKHTTYLKKKNIWHNIKVNGRTSLNSYEVSDYFKLRWYFFGGKVIVFKFILRFPEPHGGACLYGVTF